QPAVKRRHLAPSRGESRRKPDTTDPRTKPTASRWPHRLRQAQRKPHAKTLPRRTRRSPRAVRPFERSPNPLATSRARRAAGAISRANRVALPERACRRSSVRPVRPRKRGATPLDKGVVASVVGLTPPLRGRQSRRSPPSSNRDRRADNAVHLAPAGLAQASDPTTTTTPRKEPS